MYTICFQRDMLRERSCLRTIEIIKNVVGGDVGRGLQLAVDVRAGLILNRL